MEYDTKNHSKFFIGSHLIFVGKDRKKWLVRYADATKMIVEEIGSTSDFSFEAWRVIKILFTVW